MAVLPESLNNPPAEMYYIPIGSMFAANMLLGLWAQIFSKRDNSWIDVMWGITFVIPNVIIQAWRFENLTARMLLITIPVYFWGFRLAYHIWKRHKAEDYRYKEMREGWEAKGTCYYFFAAFTFVYGMQGVFSVIVNSSVLYVNLFTPNGDVSGLTYLDIIGILIWVLGFMIEWIADRQLTAHLAAWKADKRIGKFIRTGLWKYSRHPNYFGEAVMWWGLYIISCGLDYGWVTVFSAAFITFLLRFVSGVPFPEKKYANNPEWKIVCEETNVFCLWFPFKSKTTHEK